MTDILMVDDDSEFRDLIIEYLGQEGLSVAQAEDGVLGLEKIAKANYELILLETMTFKFKHSPVFLICGCQKPRPQ